LETCNSFASHSGPQRSVHFQTSDEKSEVEAEIGDLDSWSNITAKQARLGSAQVN
jgi:hypothetical protein